MWVVVARQARPPVRIWAGRTTLALVDAAAWPVAWIAMIVQLPLEVGLVGRVSVAIAALVAAKRLWTAARRNGHYRFFTWRLWSLAWPLLALVVTLRAAFWLLR